MKSWHEKDIERLAKFLRKFLPANFAPVEEEQAVDMAIMLLQEYFKSGEP